MSGKRSYRSQVVGIGFDGRLDYILDNTEPGDELTLRLEPDNEHDPEAVAVYHHRTKIGYIPRSKRWVRESILEGDTHEVVMDDIDVDGGGQPQAVAITISILSDGEGPPPPPQPVAGPPHSGKSENASTGSGCGAVLFLSALVLIAFALVMAVTGKFPTKNTPTKTTGSELCPQVRPKIDEILDSWKYLGVISNTDLTRMTVWKEKWRKAGNAAQTSIALAAFCKANPSGKGTIYIWSEEDSDIVISVEDGNVWR